MNGQALSRLHPARRWITVLALLAFFLQGLALQTHIHELRPAAVKALTGHGSKAPAKPDPADQCRLCQELAHAGTFIMPSAVVASASLAFVAAGLVVRPAFVTAIATAFAWQSRAPPRR